MHANTRACIIEWILLLDETVIFSSPSFLPSLPWNFGLCAAHTVLLQPLKTFASCCVSAAVDVHTQAVICRMMEFSPSGQRKMSFRLGTSSSCSSARHVLTGSLYFLLPSLSRVPSRERMQRRQRGREEANFILLPEKRCILV